ncbi:MAG: polysaccharide biosynthesis tyrosine autokinase [Solirubrobacteraceae bacterium]
MERGSNLEITKALRILRRRFPIILLCLLATAAAAYLVSKSQRKQYTATASIVFQNQQLTQQAAGLPGVTPSDPQAQTDTNLSLATLPRIAGATARRLGHGLTQGAVEGSVSVTQQGDTNLAIVAATAPSPRLAATLANAYARQAIAYRVHSDAAYYAAALRSVDLEYDALSPAEKLGVKGSTLKDRATSLQILSKLQGGEVQLAQPAVPPTSPSSPKVLRNTVLGALLGLLLGLGIAFGLERLDRRLREPSDLEEAYGLPLIGVVPESSALRVKRGKSNAARPLPGREAEIFGLLRAHVRYSNVDRELRVVLIASAAPGDGKSTVARNLAFAAASAGERVLFVEADLRRPTAANDFGVHRSPGIAEVLVEGRALEDAVQHVESSSGSSGQIRVDVLVAGAVLPPNPTQVIESHAMDVLLGQAREMYDFVIIDTPPLALLSDAFSLLRDVDGVMIVSRLGHNRRDVASRLRATLEAANAPVIGVVANGYKERGASPYGYGYGYGYGTYLGDDEVKTELSRMPSNGAPSTSTNGGASARQREAEVVAAPGGQDGGGRPTLAEPAPAEPPGNPPEQPAQARVSRRTRRWPGSRGFPGD